MDIIFGIASLFIIAAGVGVWLLYYHSGKLIYQGTRRVEHDPSDHGWAFDEAFLDVSEGCTHLWFIPAERETQRTILFSHGNAGNLGDKLNSIGIFRDMGFNVLAYDYGGYGRSDGHTHEARMIEDIRAVWRHAISTLGIPAKKIVIHGRSMGGGPSAYLATEVEAGAVVLESTFCSLTEMIKRRYPRVPMVIFNRNRFRNINLVGAINSPLLVVHSRDDTLIPFEHGEYIFHAAPEPKAFLEIFGEHQEGFWKNAEHYKRGLLDFINAHVPDDAAPVD